MIVAITGGTGFIGKKLVRRHLQRGDSIRVLSRRKDAADLLGPGVAVHGDDLSRGTGALVPFVDGVDVLYHCAGEVRDELKMRSVHVDGTSNLITAAKGRIGRWIQLSSVGVYGPRRAGVVTEEEAPNPVGTYEATKWESDRLVAEAASAKAFQCSILRPSIVFGEEMPNRSLFQMISMINRGLFFFVGEPGASANYIHVDNVVEALVRCGDTPRGGCRVYNLSDYCTLEEFVSWISKGIDREPPKVRLPAGPVRALARVLGCLPYSPLTLSRVDALTNRSMYSNERIERELGYSSVVDMKDGLLRLVEQWKKIV